MSKTPRSTPLPTVHANTLLRAIFELAGSGQFAGASSSERRARLGAYFDQTSFTRLLALGLVAEPLSLTLAGLAVAVGLPSVGLQGADLAA